MRKDYKITVKVRNNNLLRAIADMGLEPGQKLAEMIGINYVTINDYINLTKSPINQTTCEISESALKICDFLNKLPEDLWSSEQLIALKTNKAEIELSTNQLNKLSSDPLLMLEHDEETDTIYSVLAELTSREQAVITGRFALDGGEPMSLDELGLKFDVTRERIRQIEAKALRKLRHPTRLGNLRVEG